MIGTAVVILAPPALVVLIVCREVLVYRRHRRACDEQRARAALGYAPRRPHNEASPPEDEHSEGACPNSVLAIHAKSTD
jgi:hypothetical protein